MRIREIAQSRVRYGYRKIHVLLNREGWKVGKHLVNISLYKEEGLALKKRPAVQEKGSTAPGRALHCADSAEPQAWSDRLRLRSIAVMAAQHSGR